MKYSSSLVVLVAFAALCVTRAHATDDACADFRGAVMCPMDYSPVCGSDGVTYSNRCAFMVANCMFDDTLRSVDGACKADFKCLEMCPMNFAPVCGTNEETYGNMCMLVAARCNQAQSATERPLLSLKHRGECAGACIESYEPVCASNGETFGNACLLQNAILERGIQLSVAHEGACAAAPPTDDCDTMCDMDYKPVCGTDGVTYSNECVLNQARCRNRLDWLSVFEEDSCDVVCPEMCPEMYAPVCASDGATYPSTCAFMAERCRVQAADKPKLTVVSAGECAPTVDQCSFACAANEEPVCGSDGRTYNNRCELDRQNCLSKGSVSVCHDGACADGEVNCQCAQPEEPTDGESDARRCRFKCDKKLDEVCGSDGNTYKNPCLLAREACLRREQIAVASRGRCASMNDLARSDMQSDEDVCAAVTCENGYFCVAERKECFTTPCPQYKCVKNACGKTRQDPPEVPPVGCDSVCIMSYAPICGSNGVIYENTCNLGVASCQSLASGGRRISPRNRLSDCDCDCHIDVMTASWSALAGDRSKIHYEDFVVSASAMGATREQAASMFALMDTDGNGVLTEKEFTTYQATGPSSPSSQWAWGDIAVFIGGVVVGAAVLATGIAMLFRTVTTDVSVATQPLLASPTA